MVRKWLRIPSTWLAITLLLSMITAVVCVIAFGKSFTQDFLSNLLATYVGIILGVSIGVWVGGYQENIIAEQRKEKVVSLLLEEVRYNLDKLSKWREAGRGGDLVVGNFGENLRLETWRAFSEGGELEWIKDPELMDKLSKAYYHIGVVKNMSGKLFEMIPRRQFWGNDVENHKTTLFDKSDQAEKAICGTVEELLKAL